MIANAVKGTVQKLTDKFVAQIGELGALKEKDIMEV